MDSDLARAKASGHVLLGVAQIASAGDILWAAGHRTLARQCEDLLFQLLQLDREILELPPQSSVPPPLEHDPNRPE